MQCSIDGVCSIAMSQLRLSGTLPPRRQPKSAVIERDALRVVDAVDDRFGREAAEDHRVRGADSRACEHRDRQLGNHRHVDRDAIASANPEVTQPVGEAVDVVEQLAVGDRPAIARLAFVVVGDLFAAARAHVPVQAVDRHVELAVARTSARTARSIRASS